MKKKSQIIIFILLVTTLIVLNRVFISLDNFEITETPDMVDHEQISSQKLFDNSWKIIRDNWEKTAVGYGLTRRQIEEMRPAFSACY